MEFNKLVKTYLYPILQKYGFEIKEELKNILHFQSSIIEVNIVFNDFEKSCYVFMGKKGELLHELRNNAVRELFNSSLSVEQVTPETLVQNLSVLFKTKEGVEILKGNIDAFINFKLSEAENYTSELIRKQILDAALKAWENNDYVTFRESIEKIGIDKVPQSFQLKYKIAKQRL